MSEPHALHFPEEAWEAYETAQDPDERGARWSVIAVCWLLGQDELVETLIKPMSAMELVDLESSLDSLRHDVYRAAEEAAAREADAERVSDHEPGAEPPPGEVRRDPAVSAVPWPPGARETCKRLEAEYPGWSVFWAPEYTRVGYEKPAGYRAVRGAPWPTGLLYGADPDELVLRMDEAEREAAEKAARESGRD